MPILSEPGNYNPVLFESKTRLCNCYAVFNAAYRNLERLLMDYVQNGQFDGKILDDTWRGFLTAYILLGDEDKKAAPFRGVFIQYALIAGMLAENTHASRFIFQRGADKRPFDDWDERERAFYSRLSALSARKGETISVNEESVPPIGNLAMFAGMTKGYISCESQLDFNLAPDDFLMRFILAAAGDDSPLLELIERFSWIKLPEEYIKNRPGVFLAALKNNTGELNTGHRYVLTTMLNAFKDYALDEETAEWFRFGYEHYSGLSEESVDILDSKSREYELFRSYRGERADFPDTPHFKRLTKDFALSDINAFIQATFTKNEFSKLEAELMETARKHYDNTGFLESLMDQIYYLNPMKGFSGGRRIHFEFGGYPKVIYANFAQYSEDAVNFFWLPELPSKILTETGEEFYKITHVKKLRDDEPILKFDMDISLLDEPFKGMYLYAYGVRLLHAALTQGFFTDNPALDAFVGYLRNLPGDMAVSCSSCLLKHGAFLSKAHTQQLMDQLIYISPNAGTLKRAISQGVKAGKHTAVLLETIGVKRGELGALLGRQDFSRLVNAMIDWECSDIYYNEDLAWELERGLLDGKDPDHNQAVYLSACYAAYNYRSANTAEALGKAAALFVRDDNAPQGISTDISVRFLSLYIKEKTDRLEFDGAFTGAVGRLWELSEKRGLHKDEVCAALWRLLAIGDSPSYKDLLPHYKKISDAAPHDSCVIHEFLLYRRLAEGRTVSEDEADLMRRLYKAQGIITARTRKVAQAVGASQWLSEELIAYEWVEADPAWSGVSVSEASYGEGHSAEPAAEGGVGFTYVFKVGYVNVFTLNYTENGENRSRVIKRRLSEDPAIRGIIFQKAREWKPGKEEGYMLLAGRMCVEENRFAGDVLFDYIDCLSHAPGAENEYKRAVAYVMGRENDLVKSCIFSPDKRGTAERLKRFYKAALYSLKDFDEISNTNRLFAYIKSLERIAGAEYAGLYEYLVAALKSGS
ncbi:MAG: hypothetical protein LBS19_05940 [Clostridiales bacterium]|nr:hypothetical protein [Clostridiales bacterium]